MQNNKHLTIYLSTYDDINNPHYGGGGAIAVHEVAKRLSTRYTVRVLSWNYNGVTNETIDGVHYERFGNPSLSPKIAMFAYQSLLPFIVKRKHFDIFLESFCPPFTTAFLPRYIKKPVVGIVHMLAAEDMERKYKLPFHLVQNNGLRLYKHLIVTSDALQKKVQVITPSSTITVISNGVEKVVAGNSKKDNYILFLGRIEVDQKGIDLLIDAFKEFSNKFSEYELIIAGTGDKKEVAKMQTLITQSGVKDKIKLIGKVAGAEKEQLLQRAACVVIPSRFETFSLVALEAVASGAPVVCFGIEGLSWLPETIAKKAAPYNVSAFVEAFSVVITDKTLAERMSKKGLDFAKQYTWDAIAEKYMEYVEKVSI